MITAEHLSRSFSGNGLKLRDLNFYIEKGDCVGLDRPKWQWEAFAYAVNSRYL